MKKKSPAVAFLLNFFLGGIGFSYLNLSPTLTIAGIIILIGAIIEGVGTGLNSMTTSTSGILGGLVVALGLGMAGYALAEWLNKTSVQPTTQGQQAAQPTAQAFCKSCGTKNTTDSKFCASCGKQIN